MTKVLDHGYVTLVESWGSDAGIIEAARMSTGKGFLGWGSVTYERQCNDCMIIADEPGGADPCIESGAGHRWMTGEGVRRDKPGDEKLLRYLWENAHATPFEMAGAIFEVKAPIFVFREWHRHRTQSYNEMSARYVPLPDENYTPSVERLMLNGGANKQANAVKGASELTLAAASHFRASLVQQYEWQQGLYERALALGVPKELARIHLPVARYSRMRASANLRNWLGFLTLRNDPRAQWEIRQYAIAVEAALREAFPRTLAIARPTP